MSEEDKQIQLILGGKVIDGEVKDLMLKAFKVGCNITKEENFEAVREAKRRLDEYKKTIRYKELQFPSIEHIKWILDDVFDLEKKK